MSELILTVCIASVVFLCLCPLPRPGVNRMTEVVRDLHKSEG